MVALAQAASWYCHKESKILGNHLANLFQIVDWELRLKTVNWFAQHHMSVVDPGLEATVCLLDQTMAPFPTMQPSCQKTRQHCIHYQFRTTYSYSGCGPMGNYPITLINGGEVILNISDPKLRFLEINVLLSFSNGTMNKMFYCILSIVFVNLHE